MRRRGLLFDLDGTLADTAPDLVAVLNQLLARDGRPPAPFAIARNEVSNGAVGLLRLGFGLAADAPVDDSLRRDFLELYASMGHTKSRLFIDFNDLLEVASNAGAAWGVVTNKPAALTEALLAVLGIRGQAGTVVSGDTLPVRKPNPAPLLHAAGELGIAPVDCIYLGDAERDIVAGRAAGMRTVATSYGYIRPDEEVGRWGADACVDHPRKIGRMLQLMTGSGR